MKCLLNLGECQCIDFAGKIAGFIACDPFELIENVVNNNNQIKAVKQAFDRLDLAGYFGAYARKYGKAERPGSLGGEAFQYKATNQAPSLLLEA